MKLKAHLWWAEAGAPFSPSLTMLIEEIGLFIVLKSSVIVTVDVSFTLTD